MGGWGLQPSSRERLSVPTPEETAAPGSIVVPVLVAGGFPAAGSEACPQRGPLCYIPALLGEGPGSKISHSQSPLLLLGEAPGSGACPKGRGREGEPGWACRGQARARAAQPGSSQLKRKSWKVCVLSPPHPGHCEPRRLRAPLPPCPLAAGRADPRQLCSPLSLLRAGEGALSCSECSQQWAQAGSVSVSTHWVAGQDVSQPAGPCHFHTRGMNSVLSGGLAGLSSGMFPLWLSLLRLNPASHRLVWGVNCVLYDLQQQRPRRGDSCVSTSPPLWCPSGNRSAWLPKSPAALTRPPAPVPPRSSTMCTLLGAQDTLETPLRSGIQSKEAKEVEEAVFPPEEGRRPGGGRAEASCPQSLEEVVWVEKEGEVGRLVCETTWGHPGGSWSCLHQLITELEPSAPAPDLGTATCKGPGVGVPGFSVAWAWNSVDLFPRPEKKASQKTVFDSLGHQLAPGRVMAARPLGTGFLFGGMERQLCLAPHHRPLPSPHSSVPAAPTLPPCHPHQPLRTTSVPHVCSREGLQDPSSCPWGLLQPKLHHIPKCSLWALSPVTRPQPDPLLPLQGVPPGTSAISTLLQLTPSS
ncbi:hypothetical protein Cadr_000006519 [Camelus dromedarius]|uniref:Uncharacterized protein n=1 Tax=Camelus dromedarius TaxID=9838 RepID=A0A5N4E3K0_CAMDR|nr:hypothetical protein Cadr_000006519 [Camelus dromedarius]